MKVRPTDLTTLAVHNDGEFPALQVVTTLGQARGSHGLPDMPVWGQVFRDSGQSEATVRLRVYNITKHLETIQEPVDRPAKPEKQDTKMVQDVPVNSGAAISLLLRFLPRH